jgi:hypothetical protein
MFEAWIISFKLFDLVSIISVNVFKAPKIPVSGNQWKNLLQINFEQRNIA